jgi:hypothetical protein
MNLSDTQETFVVVLTTLFGGAGLEFVRKVLSKSKDREDSATAMRKELREELVALRAEAAASEKELDLWKQKYYELFEIYILIKVQKDALIQKLVDSKILYEDPTLPSIEKPGGETVDKPPADDVS